MIPYYERDGLTLYAADCREVMAAMNREGKAGRGKAKA